MRINPKEPKATDRDRFVLSNRHVGFRLYTVLALKGYFPMEDLVTLRYIDSRLRGHLNMDMTLGIDMSTSSLKQGTYIAA